MRRALLRAGPIVVRRGTDGQCLQQESIMKDIERDDATTLADPPGIVIHGTFGPVPQPSIVAFIWGGKVRPVPALPYGRPA
jgi:hypothetical protein